MTAEAAKRGGRAAEVSQTTGRLRVVLAMVKVVLLEVVGVVEEVREVEALDQEKAKAVKQEKKAVVAVAVEVEVVKVSVKGEGRSPPMV